MSSVYVKQNKELSGVKVISKNEAFIVDKKTGKRTKFNPDYEFVGKVDMAFPNVILKANRKNKKTAFVDDVNELPKRAKQELANHFYDKNGNRNKRNVAFLVRTDRKSKTKPQLRKIKKKKVGRKNGKTKK